MQETLTQRDRAVRLEVHEPTSQPSPAIVLLHGSGGNVGWWIDRIAPQVTAAGIALFAPHYLDSTGTASADYAMITDGKHFPQWLDAVDDALRSIATRPTVDPTRIAIVGVSLGAFLGLALAARLSASPLPEEQRRVRCIADLSGGLAEPWRSEATSAFPPTLVIHGEADNIVHLADAQSLLGRLRELNIEHDSLLLPGEGHWFSDAAQLPLFLRLSSFLSQHLKPSPR